MLKDLIWSKDKKSWNTHWAETLGSPQRSYLSYKGADDHIKTYRLWCTNSYPVLPRQKGFSISHYLCDVGVIIVFMFQSAMTSWRASEWYQRQGKMLLLEGQTEVSMFSSEISLLAPNLPFPPPKKDVYTYIYTFIYISSQGLGELFFLYTIKSVPILIK